MGIHINFRDRFGLGRGGRFRGARNRGPPRQIPPFYGRGMADFGRSPGPRISAEPPTYSPVLMYLGIQVLAGCQELEIATFANTVRCFWTSGNPGFEQFRGPRNRDFRDEVPAFWWPAIYATRPGRPIRGSNGP